MAEAIRWNEAAGRFTDASGRFISDARVRAVVDSVADAASDRMAVASQALLDGRSSLAAWQMAMMQDIKQAHVAAGVLAHGGEQQMTPSAYGFLGSEVKAQYQYLRAFAADIGSGLLPLDGRLVARAGMYGQHARATFEAVRAKDAAAYGYDEERSILHSGDPCGQCPAQAALGWVPLGTLIPIGQRTCLSRCRCTISRRRAAEAVVPLRAAG
jgi:hypothetical protein